MNYGVGVDHIDVHGNDLLFHKRIFTESTRDTQLGMLNTFSVVLKTSLFSVCF